LKISKGVGDYEPDKQYNYPLFRLKMKAIKNEQDISHCRLAVRNLQLVFRKLPTFNGKMILGNFFQKA